MMNEEGSIPVLFKALTPVLAKLSLPYELIIVNDGSSDQTLNKLLEHQKTSPQLSIIDLSRNFGKEAALTCGLAHATGDAVINLDADLQDSPELILTMIQKWQEGYEMVTVVRQDRKEDTLMHRLFVTLFYRFINKMSEVKIPPNVRDYRLMSRACLNAYLELKERTRFNKGLFAWIGFREYQILQPLNERAVGSSKWSFKKLFKFAIDGITSFGSTPLRIWSYIGLTTALFAFIYGIYITIKTLIFGNPTPGYTSMLAVILFFSGLNMLSVGIMGEYIARIFIETKARPLYVIRNIHRAE